MQEIKVLHAPSENEPYAVIYKPSGIPSAPLLENDSESALSQTIRLFPELKAVKGRKEIEAGLLHRIDTPTEGILLIAANQDFYDYILEEQKNDRFIKTYEAECEINIENSNLLEGFPEAESYNFNKNSIFLIQSYFRNYGEGMKEVRPVTEKSGKAALKKLGKLKTYTTKVQITEKNQKTVMVKCQISQGFRHQVRCHLAWIGLPISGDQLYNSKKSNTDSLLKFKATGIQFADKSSGKIICYSI